MSTIEISNYDKTKLALINKMDNYMRGAAYMAVIGIGAYYEACQVIPEDEVKRMMHEGIGVKKPYSQSTIRNFSRVARLFWGELGYKSSELAESFKQSELKALTAKLNKLSVEEAKSQVDYLIGLPEEARKREMNVRVHKNTSGIKILPNDDGTKDVYVSDIKYLGKINVVSELNSFVLSADDIKRRWHRASGRT